MKKIILYITLITCLFAFSACNKSVQDAEDQLLVYSFFGENEQFEISNGVIVLTDTQNIFDGGDLRAIEKDAIENIKAYRTEFYTLIDGKKETIFVDVVENMTEDLNAINIEGDIGRISGGGNSVYSKLEGAEDLKNNLWCEITTTDSAGKEIIYSIQLNLTEITG
jgi:hypothetical protein